MEMEKVQSLKLKVKSFSKEKRAEIRYLSDLKKVLYDKEWAKNAPNFALYYIYRGLKPPSRLVPTLRGKEKNELRYDITIIPPKILGKEFVKTKGHFHIGNFGELYKVLEKEGIFLVQKGKEKIEDVYYVKAKKGDYVLIPPHYGHVTINPSSKTLKMANWISKKCLADYKSIERKKGACYYYTISGWIKNKNYKFVPKIKSKRPLKKFPKSLNFLYGN